MQKTLENLTKAFIGESQARNRYSFYSKIASKEGFEQIAGIFLETADQEMEHAKNIFKHIQELKKKLGGDLEEIKVEVIAPTTYGNTAENLKSAIAGENYEYTKMYPEFTKIAIEENLQKIADRLLAISQAEKHHEERYKKLLKELEAGTIFKKEKETTWVCRECGFMLTAKSAPIKCPSCDHSQTFYQVKCENY